MESGPITSWHIEGEQVESVTDFIFLGGDCSQEIKRCFLLGKKAVTNPDSILKSRDFYGTRFKVLRGGSWFSNLDLARVTVRGKGLPDRAQNWIGFRCAQ